MFYFPKGKFDVFSEAQGWRRDVGCNHSSGKGSSVIHRNRGFWHCSVLGWTLWSGIGFEVEGLYFFPFIHKRRHLFPYLATKSWKMCKATTSFLPFYKIRFYRLSPALLSSCEGSLELPGWDIVERPIVFKCQDHLISLQDHASSTERE